MKTIFQKHIQYFLLAFLLVISSYVFAQKNSVLRTAKYGGKYSYGKISKESQYGSILVYPDTDSTFLFFLKLNKGVPFNKTGALYGQMKIKFGIGLYYFKPTAESKGCKLLFRISESKLEIETLEECNECGFGTGMYADGNYMHTDRNVSEYFTDLNDTKVYFKKTRPEVYNKK
jgi:hypothetical protein